MMPWRAGGCTRLVVQPVGYSAPVASLLHLLLACAAGTERTPAPGDSGALLPSEAELPAPADLPLLEGPPELLTSWWAQAPIETEEDWLALRDPEIRLLLRHYEYGWPASAAPGSLTEVARHELGTEGASLRELDLEVQGLTGEGPGTLRVALFLPAGEGPFPVLLGLNKCGNHSVIAEPALALPTAWLEPECDGTEAGRGSDAAGWAIEAALARGVAVATVHQSEVAPDDPAPNDPALALPDLPVDAPEGSAWGTLAAWSWGLSRVIDGLSTLPELGPVAVWGHSRRGKVALLTAAWDERVALCWAHQSGTGGASLSRAEGGESVAAITALFPHWFADIFDGFAGREAALPFDQHLLLALVAPRPLLLTDGDQDDWAEPAGAEQAAALARPAWPLRGGAEADLSWQLRAGGHEVRAEDWTDFLDFAQGRW